MSRVEVRDSIRVVRVKDVASTVRMLRSSAKVKQESLMLVKGIMDDVRARGDDALIEYTKRFDNVLLSKDRLRVSKDEVKDAYNKVSEEEVKALKKMKERIERVEYALLDSIKASVNVYERGIKIARVIKPIESVGCYIPGGKARYPSSMLMCALPAKVAGVKRIIACTPPMPDASIDPLTLVAADIAGVDEVYKVGGAQAIAAMAYGTESIKHVSKIVGPGGMVVNIAKLLAADGIAIDMFAGPTELLILADDTADARLIALDLAAQAEHSEDTICGLVTCSEDLAYNTIKELSRLSVARGNIVEASMKRNGFIALCKGIEDAICFVDEFAPEHLQIMVKDAKGIAERVSNAGMILVGKYSASAASDYCTGTNHVLPTSGVARARGSLTCLDFLKVISMVELSRDGLESIAEYVGLIARAEGLENHYRAVNARLEPYDDNK